MKTIPHPYRSGLLRRFLSGLLGLIVACTFARAQTAAGSLSGQVTETLHGAPLAGAIVNVDGTSVETTTDRAGGFYFSELAAGSHTVKVSYLGYSAKEFPVTIVAGQRASLAAGLGDDAVKLDTFKIEGQRVGQARALNQQRAADSLKNIVAADALGRFPDQNAAEALGRISGISLQQDQGEGRFVVVRGIDPNLNQTTVNGVVLPSSEGEERTINLDVIPSDLLSSITVTKASTPDMEGSAIGGTVDLRTQSAFDQKGRVLTGSLNAQYSHLQDKTNSGKGDVSYSNQFKDGTVGLVLSASFQRRQFDALDAEAGAAALTAAPGGGSFYLPSKYVLKDYHVQRDRAGVSAAFELKPSADDYFYLRTFYTYFADTEHDGEMSFPLAKGVVKALTADSASVAVNKTVINSKNRLQSSDLFNMAAGGEHKRNEYHWDWMLSFAYAAEETPHEFDTKWANSKNDTTTLNFNFADIYRPDITQTAFTNKGDLSKPDGYFLTTWDVEDKQAHENQWALVGNLQKDMLWAGNPGYWKVGVKYRTATKHYDKNEPTWTGPTLGYANFTARNSFPYFRPQGADYQTFDFGKLKSYFYTHPGDYIFDPVASGEAGAESDFHTDENVLAGYAMAKVKVGQSTWIGGVRVEQTSFKTEGNQLNYDASGVYSSFTPVSASRDYANVLPSVNYHYDFSDRLVFRASATRSISRPKYEDSAFRRAVDPSAEEVTTGNPNLKPYQATNLDASLEYYMPHLGLLSAGVFYKDIADFIFTQKVTGGDAATGFDLLTPLNGKRASITGLEFTWQQQFTFLPSPFDGLGVYANLTNTSSDSTLGGDDGRAGEKFNFVGQSKNLANVALTYEKYGLFVRLAANYRSSNLNEIGASALEDLYVDSHFQLDLTSRYRLSQKCSLFFNVTNLNNEPYRVYSGVSHTLAEVEYYSWAADIGIQLRF